MNTERNYFAMFVFKERADGSTFHCVDKTNPNSQPLSDLIYKIHDELFGGCLPNDWIYNQICSAFERLEQCNDENSYECALNEIEGDIYSNNLLDWAKYSFSLDLIDEELRDGFKPDSMINLIQMAQTRAIDQIYSYVWGFLNVAKEL